MMRTLFGLLCVCALTGLPLVGCGDSDGGGGSGGEGGTGGGGGAAATGGTGGGGGSTGQEFPCTEQGIRDAIAKGGGPHTFDCDGPTTVESTFEIDDDVVLDGEGQLTIDGGIRVSGNAVAELSGFRLSGPGFVVDTDPDLPIEALVVLNDAATLVLSHSMLLDSPEEPMSVINWSDAEDNLTTLVIDNSVIWNNGFQSGGRLTLMNSTISGPGSVGMASPGEAVGGTVTVMNSTISSDSGVSMGGTVVMLNSTVISQDPIEVINESTVTLLNCTVSGDWSLEVGVARGVFANTIIEGACEGSITSNGYNIESPGNTCGFDQPTDQVDVSAEDLKLEPLADNGGATETRALREGSVAIDRIPEEDCLDAGGAPLAADQRGVARPQGSSCDVGAFERDDCAGLGDGAGCALGNSPGTCLDGSCQVEACASREDGTPCLQIEGEGPGGPSIGSGVCANGFCEDRCENDEDCINDYNDCRSDTCLDNGLCESVQDGTPCAGGTCQSGVCALQSSALPCTEQGIRNAVAAGSGPYTFECEGLKTIVTEATIRIERDVILDAEGKLTLDGNDEHQLFSVQASATAELQAFTLTRGGNNGALYNIGTLMFADSSVSGSSGFGIDNDGELSVVNCTVSGNAGEQVPGCEPPDPDCRAQVFNQGSLTLINSTLSSDSGAEVVLAMGPDRGETASERSVFRGECALYQPLISDGYNIESPADTCGFDQETDQVNVSAENLKLGPLADNGGGTETHALGAGSVAIDKIPADDCVDADGAPLTTDQRGVARPLGGSCDVGAFELEEGGL